LAQLFVKKLGSRFPSVALFYIPVIPFSDEILKWFFKSGRGDMKKRSYFITMDTYTPFA
jgi:hypothetical protein